jgi:hypothetical protein
MDSHNNLNKRWYEGLLKSLSSGQSPEDSFKHMNAYGVRDTSEAAAAKFLQDQYGANDVNDIKKHFEKPELLDNISVSENPKMLAAENANGLYIPKQKKIVLNSGEDLATGLHELSHPYDEAAHGYYNLTDALTGNKKSKGLDLGAKGLEAAEELNRGHFFQDNIKGLEQLKRLMKGDKLRSMVTAISPALKAAGPAAALYAMSQGDAFAADPTGLLQADEVGKNSDIVPKDEQFDFSPYKTESQTKYDDLKKKLLPSS